MPKYKRGFKLNVIQHTAGSSRPRIHGLNVLPLPNGMANTLAEVKDVNTCPAETCDSVIPPATQYRQATCEEIDAWRIIEQDLLNVRVGMEVPVASKCSVCELSTAEPIRCLDCGHSVIFCNSCESKQHKSLLHKPEIWQGAMFIPYCGTPIVLRQFDHKCMTEIARSILLLDDKGRIHNSVVICCNCEPQPCTLLRHGFWASSPTDPGIGFSTNLLDMMQILSVECAVSVKGFLEALRWKNGWTSWQFTSLYRVLIGECIASYRNFVRRFNTHHLAIAKLTSEISKCPACPKTGGTTTISIDANFGLVRKHHSGTSPRSVSIVDGYFVDAETVDAFVTSYSDDKTQDNECNTFLAADTIRTKQRNAKLHTRGVFGSVCRHELPQLFMDMKHAERLAYPVLMIKELQSRVPADTRLQITYDIACVLSRHLKRTNQDEILSKVVLGVPVFHAYGHESSCQNEFSVRHLSGLGLTDGEGIERIWSFLRPLSVMTKEMTPTHRTELLEDALQHYYRRKVYGLAKWFNMRLIRAADAQREALENANKLKALLSVTDEQVVAWAAKQKQKIKVHLPPNVYGWKSSYVKKLQSYYTIRAQLMLSKDAEVISDLRKKLDEEGNSLANTEKCRRISRWSDESPQYRQIAHSLAVEAKSKILQLLYLECSNRAFLLQLRSRYSDGQTIAVRITNQLKKAGTAIRKFVTAYNSVQGFDTGLNATVRETINDKDVVPDSFIFTSVANVLHLPDESSVPVMQRLQAVMNFHLCERSAEEVQRVNDDLTCAIHHFIKVHDGLSQAVRSSASLAERALLYRKTAELELIMRDIWKVASVHITVPEMPFLDAACSTSCSDDMGMDNDDDDTIACISSDEECLE